MLSSQSNTNNQWLTSIATLGSNPKKPGKNIERLISSGIETLYDLIWILPLRIQNAPTLQEFHQVQEDKLFLGSGKIIGVNSKPAFGRRGKGRIQLFNISIEVQDHKSSEIMSLKFFNAYPNQVKNLEVGREMTFMGKVQNYKGQVQIANPNINPKETSDQNGLLVQYPTVSGVSGTYVKKLVSKIPQKVWETNIISKKNEYRHDINLALKKLHGLVDSTQYERDEAKDQLIYFEFFEDQLKIMARRKFIKSHSAKKYEITDDQEASLFNLFPYSLTQDQNEVWKDLKKDLNSGHPMMRMIQGDVGCGKTTIAMLASYLIAQNAQVALMCPTESLARQHLITYKEIFKDYLKVEILVGSTKAKEKKDIYARLENNEIDIIIGTHSLFQEAVIFSNLQLAIIDEQHKFGVEQRLKLIKKGSSVHSIIMSATPIPRTLQLAQYGDLDISTIRTMPSGRKIKKTRIITNSTYDKYLSFIKTRVSIGEQVYVVAPAIEESETLNIKNVNEIESQYIRLFPDLKIQSLHGKLKSDEKNDILDSFKNKKIDILISTSVIEVGINVKTATVMSIYNPNRFGLSSLHQLRGRVGRGELPGFCFLIMKDINDREALQRLKILEQSDDGFTIAEADLKNRGEGDLFGVNQSGNTVNHKVASIFEHFSVFEQVNKDIKLLESNNPEYINELLEGYSHDKKVSSTI